MLAFLLLVLQVSAWGQAASTVTMSADSRWVIGVLLAILAAELFIIVLVMVIAAVQALKISELRGESDKLRILLQKADSVIEKHFPGILALSHLPADQHPFIAGIPRELYRGDWIRELCDLVDDFLRKKQEQAAAEKAPGPNAPHGDAGVASTQPPGPPQGSPPSP